MDVFQEAELLRRVPMFSKLDPSKLKLLAFTSRALRFAPGEAMVRVGEASDSAYLIVEGAVEVLGSTRQGEFVVSVRGSNELIGEMGVLMNAPRSATVRAKGPVTALRISGDVFLKLLTENPSVALDVMRQLSERLTLALRKTEQLQERLQQNEAAGAKAGA